MTQIVPAGSGTPFPGPAGTNFSSGAHSGDTPAPELLQARVPGTFELKSVVGCRPDDQM